MRARQLRDALNNFILKLFSTQRQKHPRVPSLPLLAAFTLRGFSFAHNIMHLQCVMLTRGIVPIA